MPGPLNVKMTKLTIAFRNFAKGPENWTYGGGEGVLISTYPDQEGNKPQRLNAVATKLNTLLSPLL